MCTRKILFGQNVRSILNRGWKYWATQTLLAPMTSLLSEYNMKSMDSTLRVDIIFFTCHICCMCDNSPYWSHTTAGSNHCCLAAAAKASSCKTHSKNTLIHDTYINTDAQGNRDKYWTRNWQYALTVFYMVCELLNKWLHISTCLRNKHINDDGKVQVCNI